MEIKLIIKNNDIVSTNYVIDHNIKYPQRNQLVMHQSENEFFNSSTMIFVLEMFLIDPFNFK